MNETAGAEGSEVVATPVRGGDALRRFLVLLSYLDDTELEELYGVAETLFAARDHFLFSSHHLSLTGTLAGTNLGGLRMPDQAAPSEDRAARTLSFYAALRSRSRPGPSGADLIHEAREERQARIAPGVGDG